jgi:adenine deaminase
MATSGAWETFSVVVVGADDADMAAAANRVLRDGGRHRGLLPGRSAGRASPSHRRLPVGVDDWKKSLGGSRAIQEKAEALGFPFADATLTLATLTTAAIPFLRLSEDGLVDVKQAGWWI